MTPREQAIELVEKYYDKIEDIPIECGMYCLGGTIDKKLLSKQCALIAVNEFLDMSRVMGCKNCCPNAEYWQDVKTEIESL